MPPWTAVLEATFWICALGIVYAYVGYPLLLGALARQFGGHPETPSDEPGELPRVTLLIAAHDEEAVIEGRLHNALAMDYPRDRLEVVVGSDGSTDRTAEIVRGFAGDGVRLLDYGRRRGKAAVLNSALAEIRGEIVLMSDANTHLDPEALRRLVRWFRDPDVGVVCGRLVLTDPRSGRNADGLYWRYETHLKRQEARLGALLGANGAVYAIRRSCYVPIPDATIVDDFVIPLLAKIRTNCRIHYEPDAVAREQTPPNIRAEFRRRCRIGAGDFQSLGLLWPLLDPRRGWISLAFVSHKLIRWLCPFFLIGAFASSAALWMLPPYRVALAGQVGFYLMACLAPFVPAGVRPPSPVRLATMFTAMNAALFVGFCRWMVGVRGGAWDRTARNLEEARPIP